MVGESGAVNSALNPFAAEVEAGAHALLDRRRGDEVAVAPERARLPIGADDAVFGEAEEDLPARSDRLFGRRLSRV